MTRRTFLQHSALSAGIFAAMPLLADSSPETRRFTIRQRFSLQHDEGGVAGKLWNPLPLDAPWQRVSNLRYEGNAAEAYVTDKNVYGAKTLYAGWKPEQNERTLDVSFDIETTERVVPLALIKKASTMNLPIPEEAAPFLMPTEHVPDTKLIREKVAELTYGLNGRFEKGQAIYEWIVRTTFRDPDVKGCGVGHAGKMMASGYFGGKCTDVSSLFVAFLRSAGIPAREVFGIRVGPSRYAPALGSKPDANGMDISGAQHCRCEYFIPGAGWIPADPADVTKLKLAEKLHWGDKKLEVLKERYLHSCEMNWIGYNWARDFVLYPQPEQYPLNMLSYPYGEMGDEVLDYYAPRTFAYTFTSYEK